ncbi:MAG: AAA family ATPase [Candidatus Brocadiae bacterium]|nr:AAA family ATPase [Candidatus Brocadiia bacterium]
MGKNKNKHKNQAVSESIQSSISVPNQKIWQNYSPEKIETLYQESNQIKGESGQAETEKHLDVQDLYRKASEAQQRYQEETEKLLHEKKNLQNREIELQKKSDSFELQKQSLEGREQQLLEAKKIWTEREQNISQREKIALQKESELQQRELNALADCARQKREMLDGLNQEVRRLQEDLGKLQKQISEERIRFVEEIAQERVSAKKSLEKELEEERSQNSEQIQAQKKEVGQKLEQETKEMRSKLEKEIASDRQILALQIQAYQDDREQFVEEKQQQEAELLAREKELQRRENAVSTKEELLQEDRDALDQKIELKAGENIKKLRHELEINNKFLEELKEKRYELEKQLEDRSELERKYGAKPEFLLEEVKESRKAIKRLETELAHRPDMKDKERLDNLQAENDKLRDELLQIQYKYQDMRKKENINLIAVTELETLRDANKSLNARCDQAMNNLSLLEEEVKKYKQLNELPKEKEARIGVIEEPVFKIERKSTSEEDENEWLQNIMASIEKCGFYFPRRLMNAFHTSLKISECAPLTILTGVSGTGKSELPRLYSLFGGLQYELVSVQPNWDSPQDLFGFFNYMDNRFNATGLLRAMVQSQFPLEKKGFNDGMLLVLLDEMNLAKIEQYFSDMLSLLEFRRGQTEEIKLKVDIGSGLDRYEVVLGKNILFAGTVNEDESTQTLSDKTLDRANVIVFPSPDKLRSRDNLHLPEKEKFLEFATWQRWIMPASSLETTIRDRMRIAVEEINRCMKTAGRSLGHRVWQGIENYIANHPEVCRAAILKKQLENSHKEVDMAEKTADKDIHPQGTTEEKNALSQTYEKACVKAFEDQLVQKVIPKLRGIETEGAARQKCLKPIEKIIQKEAPGLMEDYQNACQENYGTFLWRSARFLEVKE